MDLLDWARARVGLRVAAPGGAGSQCVDLANLWLLALGTPEVRANAVDWPAQRIPDWTFVANTPTNFPTPGDVVCWRGNVPARGIGPYGHVAVALAADARALLTLDQDWPVGAPVAVVLHDYLGVAGWWVRPPSVIVK